MRLERSYQKNFGENPFFNLVRSINENISIYLRCIKIEHIRTTTIPFFI